MTDIQDTELREQQDSPYADISAELFSEIYDLTEAVGETRKESLLRREKIMQLFKENTERQQRELLDRLEGKMEYVVDGERIREERANLNNNQPTSLNGEGES